MHKQLSLPDCCAQPALEPVKSLSKTTRDLEGVCRCTECGRYWYYSVHERITRGSDPDRRTWYAALSAAEADRLSRMNAKPYRLALKAVILDEQDRCLLIRRSRANHNFVGCWEWPGGKVDPGEDFVEALRREVREECGLELEATGLAGATEYEMPAARIVRVCNHPDHRGRVASQPRARRFRLGPVA